MKSVTGIRKTALLLLLAGYGMAAHGQNYAETNPSTYVIIWAGRDSLNAEYSKQINEYKKIIFEQGEMNYMLTKIRNWGDEYNGYLKTVTPFLKNTAIVRHLYAQGAALIQNTMMLTKVMAKHPEGIAASVSMTNLYMETAMVFLRTYATFKKVVTKGGSDNMMKTTERIELLWLLADNMRDLNMKLRDTAYSVAIYDFNNVWQFYTTGMVPRDASQIAHQSFNRWRRIYQRYNELTKKP